MQRLKHHNIYRSIIYIRKVETYMCDRRIFQWTLIPSYDDVSRCLQKAFFKTIPCYTHFSKYSSEFTTAYIWYDLIYVKVDWQKPEKKNTSGYLWTPQFQAIHSFLFYTITHALNFHNRQVLLLQKKKISC